MKTLKLIALVGLLTSSSLLSAQTITSPFNTVTELNVDAPSGLGPWLSTSFTDLGLNHVRLELTSNLLEDEFISSFAMNINPSLNLNSLAFSNVGSSGAFLAPSISRSTDSYGGGQGTRFDIGFDFTTSNSGGGSRRFNQNDSVTYDIFYSGSGTFDAASFGFLDASGKNYSIAHVQSIGRDNTSAWITSSPPSVSIPEPSSALLGTLGVLVILRRRHK